MFGLTSTSSGNMLRRSRSYFELSAWVPEDQLELNLAETIAELDEDNNMDSSPTQSPSISPTSSEHTLTPTSSISSYSSSFGVLQTSNLERPRSDFDSPIVGLPRNPKTTIQYILASPVRETSVDEFAQTTTVSLCSPRRRASRKDSTTILTLRLATPQKIDHDGDIIMSSPLNSPSSIVVQASPTVKEASKSQSTEYLRRELASSGDSSTPIPPWKAESNFHAASLRARRTQSLSSNAQSQTQTSSHHSSRDSKVSEPAFSRLRSHIHSHKRNLATAHQLVSSTESMQTPKLHIVLPDTHKTQLRNSIDHLGTILIPLVSITTALPHPDFPRSLLQYHLLTHAQLDSLARWYHQTIDNTLERHHYPEPMARPWVWSDEKVHSRMRELESEVNGFAREVDLDTKRRRFGRFIGLRGCESPIKEVSSEGDDERAREEELEQRMEQEWRAALRRAEEEQRLLDKTWRGRW